MDCIQYHQLGNHLKEQRIINFIKVGFVGLVYLGISATMLWASSPPFGEGASKDWIRYPAISPDAKQVAFSFAGDLWVAGIDGKNPRMLTTHEGYERSPVWSPDGKTIAFFADWHGNGDVFLVSAKGGVPKRLTWHSANDTPSDFTPDGKSVVFSSGRLDAPQAAIGTAAMKELYQVSVAGGRPKQILTTPAHDASIDPSGKRIVFHDYKGFEDNWRKHHTSSVTRDIWMFDVETKKYTKLSRFVGEDRSPVFGPNGKSVYYLSERLGVLGPNAVLSKDAKIRFSPNKTQNKTPKMASQKRTASTPGGRPHVIPQLESSLNVWRLDLDSPDQPPVQISQHQKHSVRFLSVANNGTVCYGFNGEVWIKADDDEAKRIDFQLTAPVRRNQSELMAVTGGSTEFAVSPNEEEVAFIVRGEVFVTNVEFGTTRRITDTPTQERSLSWHKDGRKLYYSGERDGSWNIYCSRITRDEEDRFAYATLVTEESVLADGNHETFQPVCSPDGKKLAYLLDRRELRVLDLETKQSSTLIPADRNFAYRDGLIQFDWSPDSKWIVCGYYGHEIWVREVALVELATGNITNVTESGYEDNSPRFGVKGNAILYASDRFGERNAARTGGETDVLAVYLNHASYDDATLGKEELKVNKQRKSRSKRSKSSKHHLTAIEVGSARELGSDGNKADELSNDDEKKSKKEEEASDRLDAINVELEGLEFRRRRMTLHSSLLWSFDLSPDGEHLIYVSRVDDSFGVWLTNVRNRATRLVYPMGKQPGAISFGKKGKSAFLQTGSGALFKLELGAALAGNARATAKPIRYKSEMNLSRFAERNYIFEHAWRQVKRRFYDENLHGVDWDALKANYQAFLPSITNNHDFAELVSEMLGELNASHTGCKYGHSVPNGDKTAALGLVFDVEYEGVGLKVAEVLKQGPCDKSDSKIAPDSLITHINGTRLTPDVNPWKLLNRQTGKSVRISLTNSKGDEWEEIVKPTTLGQQNELLYQRWVRTRRDRCDELSGGRVGYVHVQGMNDASMRQVYNDVLGRHADKEFLIVDTRFNSGGWLHETLATFLDGDDYAQFAPRGFEEGGLGHEPFMKWTKPVVVLQSESNYSDAHIFPWLFKQREIGKLIGTPVPGTGTAVWWESQIDKSLLFGIPQVGLVDEKGNYLENQELDPDILIYNDPQSIFDGKDPQLEAAVKHFVDPSGD